VLAAIRARLPGAVVEWIEGCLFGYSQEAIAEDVKSAAQPIPK
jgi:hypothetical protein